MGRKRWSSYALYEGDELLFVGNSKEMAEYMGIKIKSVYFMSSPAFHKRKEKSKKSKIIYRIEEDQ